MMKIGYFLAYNCYFSADKNNNNNIYFLICLLNFILFFVSWRGYRAVVGETLNAHLLVL